MLWNWVYLNVTNARRDMTMVLEQTIHLKQVKQKRNRCKNSVHAFSLIDLDYITLENRFLLGTPLLVAEYEHQR
jgi:hypothetical protein